VAGGDDRKKHAPSSVGLPGFTKHRPSDVIIGPLHDRDRSSWP
jgi:hypothetical protein